MGRLTALSRLSRGSLAALSRLSGDGSPTALQRQVPVPWAELREDLAAFDLNRGRSAGAGRRMGAADENHLKAHASKLSSWKKERLAALVVELDRLHFGGFLAKAAAEMRCADPPPPFASFSFAGEGGEGEGGEGGEGEEGRGWEGIAYRLTALVVGAVLVCIAGA